MVAQAMSGSMSINGWPDGPPTNTSIPIADIAASMYAVQAITGALYDRDVNDAGGEYIEVSMLNCIMSWLGIRATAGGVENEPYPVSETDTRPSRRTRCTGRPTRTSSSPLRATDSG